MLLYNKKMANMIKKSAYDTVTLDEIKNDDFKGKRVQAWVEMDKECIDKFASVFIGSNDEDDDAVKLGGEYDFDEIFGADYYEDKLPGFEPYVYDILAAESKEEDIKTLFVDPKTL